MKLTVLGSSSAGNCYLLTADTGETIILECGVNFKKVKEALNFDYRNVVGALVTHEHGDHGKYTKDALAAGLKVYTTEGTAKGLGLLDHHSIKLIEEKKTYMVGQFKVMPFDIEHDVNQPVGFLINHSESGNILFVTDTWYVKYKFPLINNYIVEANYCSDLLNRKYVNGDIQPFLRNRVMTSHMSIDTCRDFLLANDLSATNHICLIHLSDKNSNEQEFHQKITAATGKTVTIAKPGVVIENFNASII